MKYMKLGTKPDIFYTEEATRTVLSDVPTDLIIQINNTKYLLHKGYTAKMSQEIKVFANHSYHLEGRGTSSHSNFPLLLNCGLLQRLCSDSSTSSPSSSSISGTASASYPIVLPDFPGGEAAFELCAKFCYNIAITLSAHNFLSAFSAATFLRMTDSVARPNFLPKLHTFFVSFILPNWKDSVVTLITSSQSSPPFSEPAIIRPLIDSIVSKILTPTSHVTWSFTYSRQLSGSSVPKDWWTEDIADLDLNHFRSIISSVRSSKILPPALIGEALHVYTVKNVPDPNGPEDLSGKDRRVLEAIVSMIPAEHGAVSGGFLMRLLKIAILVGASASVKAELVRRAGRQLDEVTVRDLVFYRGYERERAIDLGVAEAVVESFLEAFRRTVERGRMRRVARLFDEYLRVVARDRELSIDKFIELTELVPEVAREEHDELYTAIDSFLEEHPDLSKAERKRLCQLIDCRKLSPEVRSEAIANERLPLRTLVQLLFVEQERAGGASSSRGTPIALHSNARESHDEPRRSRQGQDEHRHRQQAEELAEGVRSRLAAHVIAAAGKKGEGSGSKPQANKGRGDQADAEKKKKKMAKRPG